MGRRQVELHPDRAGWRSPQDGPQRPEGVPSRPLTAVLVGGRAQYTNVSKLPALLWEHYGVAVVKHATAAKHLAVDDQFDVAVCLVDQTSHELMAEASKLATYKVRTASSWSRVASALDALGVRPFAGTNFEMPAPAPQQEQPRATKEAEMPQPKRVGLSTETKDLLKTLKDHMVLEDLRFLALELSDNGSLAVEYRKIIVTQGEETL